LGRKRARPEAPKLEDRRAESGGRVLGEGQPAPSPPARRPGGLGERCKIPSGVTKGFSLILNTQDDFSGQQDYGPLAQRIKHKNKSF